MAESSDDLDTVTGLVELAGLSASEHELELIASSYLALRRQIASLWAMTEARYAEPALIFQAEPALVSWPAP